MKEYSQKQAEWRKIWLINKFISKSEKILDLGCGPGEYGPALKKKSKFLIGADSDQNLLKIAKQRGYNQTIQKKFLHDLPFKKEEFDYIWCSEFLEHLPDLKIIFEMERITKKGMVITLPNPLSPHFKEDKTHILKYSVNSLRRFLATRRNWNYKIRGLGFEDVPLPLTLRKLTTFLLFYIPYLSPTITIIGKRKY